MIRQYRTKPALWALCGVALIKADNTLNVFAYMKGLILIPL